MSSPDSASPAPTASASSSPPDSVSPAPTASASSDPTTSPDSVSTASAASPSTSDSLTSDSLTSVFSSTMSTTTTTSASSGTEATLSSTTSTSATLTASTSSSSATTSTSSPALSTTSPSTSAAETSSPNPSPSATSTSRNPPPPVTSTSTSTPSVTSSSAPPPPPPPTTSYSLSPTPPPSTIPSPITYSSTPPPIPPSYTPATTTTTPPIPPIRTTFQSSVFVTTTDGSGSTTTSAPPTITSFLTTTTQNGGVVTLTQIGVNPTLSPDNSSLSGSSFFQKTGAVAGVFVLVGLSVAAILLWIVFAIRRRLQAQQLEHDAVATFAAGGFHRAPLDDDEGGEMRDGSRFGPSDVEMTNRSNSGFAISQPSPGRVSANFNPSINDDPGAPEFNPYTDLVFPSRDIQGYVPASTASPPPVVGRVHQRNDSSASGVEQRYMGHTASDSAASNEPLLSAHDRAAALPPPSYFASVSTPSPPPPPPPRNPRRLTDRMSGIVVIPGSAHDNQSNTSVYSTDDIGDERLDLGLRWTSAINDTKTASTSELRDEEDYSRPVLAVRNGGSSQHVA